MEKLGIDPESKRVALSEKNPKLIFPETSLDAEKILAELTYEPEMFHGSKYFGGDSSVYCNDELKAEFLEDMGFWSPENVYADTNLDSISILPCFIKAGPETNKNVINRVKQYNWMTMDYLSEEGYLVEKTGAYEISGNILSFYPLKEYEYDSENDRITYALATESIDYEFKFHSCGHLTLSLNGYSADLQDGYLSDKKDVIIVSGYLSPGSEAVEEIRSIHFSNSAYENMSPSEVMKLTMFDQSVQYASGYFGDDGLFTFSWTDQNGVDHVHQYVFFFNYPDGLILADEEHTYFYTADWSAAYSDEMEENLSYDDIEKIGDMDEAVLEEIVEKKHNLFNDLTQAFEDAGIPVTVNEETGEISMDNTVLFAVDSYELSEEGKVLLDQFLSVYASVILKEEYSGFLSEILIEGHTDTSGQYEYNLELSQKRADAVMEYCKTTTAVDAEVIQQLSGLFRAVGYSWDRPIYDAEGNVDADASRRVAFRFMIQL